LKNKYKSILCATTECVLGYCAGGAEFTFHVKNKQDLVPDSPKLYLASDAAWKLKRC
jgi:hypothetical protein